MQVTGLVPVSFPVLTVFTAELKWLSEWPEYRVIVDQLVHCTAWQAVADAHRSWIDTNWIHKASC